MANIRSVNRRHQRAIVKNHARQKATVTAPVAKAEPAKVVSQS